MIVLLGVVGAIVATSWLWTRGSAFTIAPDANENILLVTIDTLRADALSSYGGRAQTPNLDRLASHGARFTFAHSQAVVTLPSHTTILTGHFPYEHGMRDNSGFRVQDGTATLATRLKPLGFATGAFVGGFPLTKRFGLTPGFDVYDDQMPENREAITLAMANRPAADVVGRAVDWMGRQNTRFFAWVHVFDPHSPYEPPAEYAAAYRDQPYFGEVAYTDHALGALFDRLATLSRPTLVIVTSDHGESLGEHGELTHGMFAYEATLHVPLIVARVGPGTTSRTRGTVIDTPVRHIDIAPTVLDVVGAGQDSALPGASLRDLIAAGRGADRPAYFESMTYNLVRGWAPLRGVLVNREKYIDLPIPELYDLASDPKESRNEATSQADRVTILANTLKTYNTAPPGRPGRESAAANAALRSLGYVTGSAPARATYTEADDPKRLVEVDQDLHKASDFTRAGNVEAAVSTLESVVARRPDTADAYIALAYAYWQAGRVPTAIATLERGLRAGAPDRDIRIRLGIYLSESHTDAGRAIALLEGLPDDDVEALNALGIALVDAGRAAEADRAFRRVLLLDPTNGLAYQNLANLALRGAQSAKTPADQQRYMRDAEDAARQAIAADPTLAGAHTILGVVLSNVGRKADAIDAWKRAVDLDPSEFNALYNLWLELARAGRHDEAVDYGRRFVQTAPPAFFGADIEQVRKYLAGR